VAGAAAEPLVRMRCDATQLNPLLKTDLVRRGACGGADGARGHVCEAFLYHGCSWAKTQSICTEGFNCSFAGGHRGKLFGVGTYFADTFSKADLYTTAEKHEQLGEDGAAEEHVRCMIIARVILGHKYRSIRADPSEPCRTR